ncbi:MAG: ATP-dependent helicase [Intestinibacillus sp.]
MEPTKFDIKYAAVRRAVIEQTFGSLNDRQREAVFHTEGPLLVLAGAGSGKTTVLIQRIINILRFGRGYQDEYATPGATEDDLAFLAGYLVDPREEDRARAERLCAVFPAKPWEVIAITFTNKAARELQERLTRAIGEQDADAVWAHTFHTACLRILRRDIERLGYDSSFTIYDTDDQKRVLNDIIGRLKLDDKVFDQKQIESMISRAKDSLQTPAQYAVQAGNDFFMSKVAEIYTLYEKELRHANALDFDDIIMKTVKLLRENEDVLSYYQNKFRYVLVDEYQDTNHAQYVLTSLLAGGHENICVVGDDDQSIYKFRGATITNILEFEKQYRNATAIRLEQNYRSTGTILSAANELIRNNAQRKGKELWTCAGEGAKIKLHRSDTQEGEAAYIAECILDGISKGKKWSDYAILYRNNVLSNNIESAFRRNSIPYRIYRGRDFFSRAEIRDMFAYLWVIENPSDALRLKRIINVPARKIGDRSVEIAEEVAAETGHDLYTVVRHASEYPALSRGASAMEKFGKLMDDLRAMREFLPLSELYDEMLSRTGYLGALQAKSDMESRSRAENIMELKSNIVHYEEKTEEPSLGGFLEEMALYTDADHTDENEDAVLMMTMHSAKGLEFPTVFLAGLEDGIFPSFRTHESGDDLEEERRLCYVAVTRAKEQLYITCAERRMMYGQTRYSMPSRFVQEIPEQYLDSNITGRQMRAAAERDENAAGSKNSAFRSNDTYRATVLQKNAASTDVPSLKAGDRIMHKAFGEGMVTSVKPMGGDQLLEIAFGGGTKRLLAKSAMQFMQRL